ncbi:hypothetical protein [Frigidibacter sp. MR17.24]
MSNSLPLTLTAANGNPVQPTTATHLLRPLAQLMARAYVAELSQKAANQ